MSFLVCELPPESVITHSLVPCQSYFQAIHLPPFPLLKDTHLIHHLPSSCHTHLISFERIKETEVSSSLFITIIISESEIFPTNNHPLRPKSKPTTTPPNRHHQSYNQGVLQLSFSRHIINHSDTHSFISNLLCEENNNQNPP